MTEFPLLKTRAAVQYPLRESVDFSTRVLRFLGGGEQRFRQRRTGRRQWLIRLELLDEWEAARVLEFFEAQQGRAGEFAFTDPSDGKRYENCSFGQEDCEVTADGEARLSMTLVIKENVD